jgi:hypothetical protein
VAINTNEVKLDIKIFKARLFLQNTELLIEDQIQFFWIQGVKVVGRVQDFYV